LQWVLRGENQPHSTKRIDRGWARRSLQ
jgi:hypothetical protein